MAGGEGRYRPSSTLVIGALATAWSAIVAIISVPWLLKILSIEAYGLVGFFATLQAAVSVLDLGLGAMVNREVARGNAVGNRDYVNRLVHSLQALYAGAAIIIGGGIFLLAPYIRAYWLGSTAIPNSELDWSIRLMGLIIGLRWPISLFQGVLVGLDRAHIYYRMIACMSTIASFGALLILYKVNASTLSYFIWQTFSALISLIWVRNAVRQETLFSSDKVIDIELIKSLAWSSLFITGVAASGLLLSQLDKIVVSASTTLAEFGHYSLAAMISSALVIILIPTFNLIFPKMSGMSASGKLVELAQFYRVGTRLLVATLIPIAASAVFYAHDLLYVWTGSSEIAKTSTPIAQLLVIGATINGIMHFPYSLQISTGNERISLYINLINIAITVPTMILLSWMFGAIGGAIGWAVQAVVYFFIGVALTHLVVLKGLALTWVFHDVMPGMLMSLLMVGIGHALAGDITGSPIVRLAFASLVAVVAMLSVAIARADTRKIVIGLYRDRRFQ